MDIEKIDINETKEDTLSIVERDQVLLAKYGSAVLRINTVEFLLRQVMIHVFNPTDPSILEKVNSQNFGPKIGVFKKLLKQSKRYDKKLLASLNILNNKARCMMAHGIAAESNSNGSVSLILRKDKERVVLDYGFLDGVILQTIEISNALTEMIKDWHKNK